MSKVKKTVEIPKEIIGLGAQMRKQPNHIINHFNDYSPGEALTEKWGTVCAALKALESTRPKTNSAQTKSAQNQLGPKLIGPGLGDPSPLFFSFLFSFSSSSFFFFFHPLYYHWEFISLKGVSIQKIWKSGAL